MVVLIVVVIFMLLAVVCLRGEGDCYGNIDAKKDKVKKDKFVDNNFSL